MLDLGVVEVLRLVDLVDTSQRFTASNVTEDDDVEQPIVRFRHRRDPHAAAKVTAVGHHHVLGPATEIALCALHLDDLRSVAEQRQHGSDLKAQAATKGFGGAIDAINYLAPNPAVGDVDEVAGDVSAIERLQLDAPHVDGAELASPERGGGLGHARRNLKRLPGISPGPHQRRSRSPPRSACHHHQRRRS